jgi:zinc-ribbon domain
MTCPNCGASVQPGDSFCVNCGHAFNPAEPTRHLGTPDPAQPAPGALRVGAAGDATPHAVTPGPTPYRPRVVESPRGERTWASGSSFPAPNPYASPPQLSRGTMLNGRPVGSRRDGSSLLKGLGAALVALWAILHQFGHAILGLGFFKLYFLWSLFHFFMYSHVGWLVLLVILVLIAGSMRRSRMI